MISLFIATFGLMLLGPIDYLFNKDFSVITWTITSIGIILFFILIYIDLYHNPWFFGRSLSK